MSILLDALKKSEEQRQLGATPTLQTPTPGGPGPAALEQHWLPLAMMALSVVLMTWIGWQQYRQPDWGILPDTVREAPQVATRPDGEAPVSPETDASRPVADDAPRTPVETLPEQETVAAQETPEPEDREGQLDRLNQSFSNFRSETPADEPVTAAADETGQPLPLPEFPEELIAETAESEEPAEPQPMSFWELPQGVRDNMPELRITVLVYADKPEDRFLLVSGQRVVEGDTLDGNIMLEEIRREGAVFIYRSYRFLMKG
ncbi:MAG: GspB domain-containing protein [Xanthomonadales bacterium]|nr:GspB domain-containing protein [Xanthomonadales bacterium]